MHILLLQIWNAVQYKVLKCNEVKVTPHKMHTSKKQLRFVLYISNTAVFLLTLIVPQIVFDGFQTHHCSAQETSPPAASLSPPSLRPRPLCKCSFYKSINRFVLEWDIQYLKQTSDASVVLEKDFYFRVFFCFGEGGWATNDGAATTTGLCLDAYNSLINNVCIFDVLIRCIVIWNTVWRCIYGTLLWSTVHRRNHLEAKQ